MMSFFIEFFQEKLNITIETSNSISISRNSNRTENGYFNTEFHNIFIRWQFTHSDLLFNDNH